MRGLIVGCSDYSPMVGVQPGHDSIHTMALTQTCAQASSKPLFHVPMADRIRLSADFGKIEPVDCEYAVQRV
jgi:hypothetical protein